jgi:hypothetical protein
MVSSRSQPDRDNGDCNFLEKNFVSRSEVSHNIAAKRKCYSDLRNLANDCQTPSSKVHNAPKVPSKVLTHATP